MDTQPPIPGPAAPIGPPAPAAAAGPAGDRERIAAHRFPLPNENPGAFPELASAAASLDRLAAAIGALLAAA